MRTLSRREFLNAAAVVSASSALPRTVTTAEAARLDPGLPPLAPLAPAARNLREYDLTIAETRQRIDGRSARAVTINGSVPGPVLRFREGETAVLRVHNTLREDTSIHWHGIILPSGMDGVPGLSFPGIRPGETFKYRFDIQQSGTYWFHSHSGLQEQVGHYGSIIIEPATPAPPQDRQHMIVLSDWTFENPRRVLSRLKKQPDAYNYQRRTVADFFRDVAHDGFGATVRDRFMWAGMRMNPTDLADVTGATYSYLLNGQVAESPWHGQFTPGERVRLRFVNASAGTFYDVRIPGVSMRLIEVSGQAVEPVDIDEFRIGMAETYDVLVTLPDDKAYALYAETMDRSGFTAAVLAPRAGMTTDLPARRKRPILGMVDMGMDHGAMDHAARDHAAMDHAAMDHAAMGHGAAPATSNPATDAHAGHVMPSADGTPRLRAAGSIEPDTPHAPRNHGTENAMIPMSTKSRLAEPGTGLGNDGRRVLCYTDLKAPAPWPEFREPEREIALHLTGNMERFTWGLDGVPYNEATPVELRLGERVRLIMVNDTMMNHPMHLHGLWMELENGHGNRSPRIHTINVKPAERVSLLISADAVGRWAFHCHVLYHMEVGMFREFRVLPADAHAHHEHGSSSAS